MLRISSLHLFLEVPDSPIPSFMEKKIIYLTLVIMMVFGACTPSGDSESDKVEFDTANFGNYVTNHYKDRAEGYDWSVVMVEAEGDGAKIQIKSRNDKKRPSCSMNAKASVKDKNTLVVKVDETEILFSFQGQEMEILTAKDENRINLMRYCSGGGSIADVYKKLVANLDDTQLNGPH